VDVGANIGWFTLLASRRAKLVHAFEPEPTNAKLLRRSLDFNELTNCNLHQIAVADFNGKSKLYLSHESAGRHSLIRGTRSEQIEVEVGTLDGLLPGGTIDILKVDTEGSEPEVLAGATELIAGHRVKNIIMEWNPNSWTKRTSLLEPFELRMVNGLPFVPSRDEPLEGNIHMVDRP
jgi:FkbM family methyltransferase